VNCYYCSQDERSGVASDSDLLGGDVTATRASLIVAYVVVSNVVAARAKSEWSSSLRCSQIVFFQIEIRIRIFCFSFCSVEVICLIVIRLSELAGETINPFKSCPEVMMPELVPAHPAVDPQLA
jgi:hypothetical protein